jgi:hypothetical protein
MVEWQNGSVAEWQNGGMAEWYFTTYLIYSAIFMVHADDANNAQRLLNHLDVQADRACGSSAHGQTDSQLFSVLYSLMMKYVSTFVHIVM